MKFTNKKISVLLICLIILLSTVGCSNAEHPTESIPPETTSEPTETTQATEPTGHEPSIPQETHIPEASIVTEQLETDREEVTLEEALASNDLRTQREWFYDFARQWWLDYMPHFTVEDGPPSDSWEYLYWCDFVNYDYPAGENPEMTRTYVENTVRTFFGTDCGDHRSHNKSYRYDEETETYTPWPEGGKDGGYYLLNAIEDHGDGTYTVSGSKYSLSVAYVMPEEEYLLRDNLLNSSEDTETVTSDYVGPYGDTAHLTLFAEFELTFSWNNDTSLPMFKGLEVTILNDLYNW